MEIHMWNNWNWPHKSLVVFEYSCEKWFGYSSFVIHLMNFVVSFVWGKDKSPGKLVIKR